MELNFDNVTGGGFASVTESGLGPHPPGGFQAIRPASSGLCAETGHGSVAIDMLLE